MLNRLDGKMKLPLRNLQLSSGTPTLRGEAGSTTSPKRRILPVGINKLAIPRPGFFLQKRCAPLRKLNLSHN